MCCARTIKGGGIDTLSPPPHLPIANRQRQRPLLPRQRGRGRSGAASAAAHLEDRQEEQEEESIPCHRPFVVRFAVRLNLALIRLVRHSLLLRDSPSRCIVRYFVYSFE